MQIRGKILTITGIVLMFGYFIRDSLKAPYDPTQVVMIGNDTLGRDWGAMAEQLAKDRMPQSSEEGEGLESMSDSAGILKSISSESYDDPLSRQKFNQENYATIESPDGREIIIGYNRPEEQQAEQDKEDFDNGRYKSRHQLEASEPEMKYRY